MKKTITIQCPQCSTKKKVTFWDAQPRATIDCKCGAEAEIRLIKKVDETRFHAVDWYY
jgi:Zn ribbon nucleic-acid-binding protein